MRRLESSNEAFLGENPEEYISSEDQHKAYTPSSGENQISQEIQAVN